MSRRSSSERNSHGMVLLAESLKCVPPALNGLVECVGDALAVGHAVELLIDGAQHCIVFGCAGALGKFVELAGMILVESECHCHIDTVSL